MKCEDRESEIGKWEPISCTDSEDAEIHGERKNSGCQGLGRRGEWGAGVSWIRFHSEGQTVWMNCGAGCTRIWDNLIPVSCTFYAVGISLQWLFKVALFIFCFALLQVWMEKDLSQAVKDTEKLGAGRKKTAEDTEWGSRAKEGGLMQNCLKGMGWERMELRALVPISNGFECHARTSLHMNRLEP